MTLNVRAPELQRFSAEWQTLATIRDDSVEGWTRRTFSEPEHESREWIAGLFRAEGLETHTDAIGNIIGVLPGLNPSAPALVIGSHTDTVSGGGRFDGVVGVLGALEVVRMLRESGIQLKHPLRIVNYYNEEPNRFGLSCLGSRAIAANLTADHLALLDDDGHTLADALRADGRNPDAIASCAWSPGEVAASVELHIEQGPILEREGKSIGVVTAIAGIARLRAHFEGRSDHAGTMPMDLRRDASCSAAGTVLAIERIAAAGAGSVGTAGEILVEPDATNVVAARATVTAEFRSADNEWLRSARIDLDAAVEEEGHKRGVRATVDWLPPENPTAMDPAVSDALSDGVSVLGHDALRLYSGAGHDAVQMARLGPAGMLFVPSRDGRSHTPEEWTDLDGIGIGIHGIAQGIVLLDQGGGDS